MESSNRAMVFASVSQPLRYFYEVAQAGSFRQAAERINIAASALARQIGLLERELKQPLFERRPGRGKLKITAAGEILLHRVRLSMNELRVAKSAIDSLAGLKRGVVSIGVNDSIGRDFLPQFLRQFHDAYPQIDFQVVVDNTPGLVNRFERDEIEIIFAYNIAMRNTFRTIFAFPLGMCVLVASSHPLAQHTTLRLSDCVGYPLAVPDDSMTLAQVHNEILNRTGAEVRTILKTNSFELICDVVATGMAISIQTDLLLAKDLGRLNMVSVPLEKSFRIPRALACCVRAEGSLPVATAAFVEALKASVGRHIDTTDLDAEEK